MYLTSCRRDMIRTRHIIALAAACLCTAAEGLSQRPALLTAGPVTGGKHVLVAAAGAEYYRKREAPGAGLPVSEWRLGTSSLMLGVADNVDFGVEWRGRLAAALESGEHEGDWGDLTVVTSIGLFTESGGAPAIGIRSAVKLPNTAWLPHRLGSDNTDFFFSLLGSKTWGRIETRLNAGFAILGDPEAHGGQDDVFLASGALKFPLWPGAGGFVEADAAAGPRETDGKVIGRAGGTIGLPGADLSLYGSFRLAGDNRDFAGAFERTETWSMGLSVAKSIRF